MAIKRRLREQSSRESARGRGLAQARLANEEIGVREPVTVKLSSKLAEGLGVPDDSGEGIGHGVKVSGDLWFDRLAAGDGLGLALPGQPLRPPLQPDLTDPLESR